MNETFKELFARGYQARREDRLADSRAIFIEAVRKASIENILLCRDQSSIEATGLERQDLTFGHSQNPCYDRLLPRVEGLVRNSQAVELSPRSWSLSLTFAQGKLITGAKNESGDRAMHARHGLYFKVRAYPRCLIFSRRPFAAASGSFAP